MSRTFHAASDLPSGLVASPRYGAVPIPSGLSIPEAEIRAGFWALRDEGVIFPQTVLRADPSRQNYTLYPRRYYVDMLRDCRDCGRPFIFFAQEQQHWFEVLRFYVDADCVRCSECSAARRAARRAAKQGPFTRYARAMSAAELSPEALRTLVDDATDLLEAGVLRNLQKLGVLKNRALRECAEHPGTMRLVEALKRRHQALRASAPERSDP